METQFRRVKKYLEIIKDSIYVNRIKLENITYANCEYKENNILPDPSSLVPYTPGAPFGTGNDTHAWFHLTVSVPEHMQSKPVRLVAKTDRGGWDAVNPQFICYVDGVLRQGMDTNHTFIKLEGKTEYDVYLYGYTGPKIPSARFYAELVNVNENAEQLYYDILVPFEMLSYLDQNSKEYAEILLHLDNAVNRLDLFDLGSKEFFDSVDKAKAYMDDTFYGKYCIEQPSTTVCIGHTHIDCAWRWTLKQTREKVQRSFATVLELMKHYPEYKFMSSQAFLYQNLKEEAPELYEQVKQMIKAGRWECEGAMWVEADCNLSSGESLVRQVTYGKGFFKKEFGVENRVLWLPDVFGYSAAMPQILKKAGVDWFVTSKISWNESNTMPYDTFKWYGIDGTGINTFFLTPQDKKRGQAPVRYTTYVGNTHPQMIAGTYERYQQKNLNNEALLTFGFGDGGGGPTAEHLELARRTANGIPGAPNARIEFAGDFLKRLENKIENNRLLPKWHGELYLEFHRGTYTSIAKNKKNNRESEFLYQDAEHVSSVAKALVGKEFPKAELHKGWEMILTNQFHDIIPGSSIKEVYDQCDIDYAVIKEIGSSARDSAVNEVASRIGSDKGYVIFNPHSFTGNGTVKINGVTGKVKGIPSKGYAATKDIDFTCDVKVDGYTVENDVIRVTFNGNWQICSIYDKRCDREVITEGALGNELRVYADHPDVYDAWEWQPYSKDNYKVITDYSSAEVVRDGARIGIKVVRPFMSSTVTQTAWFTDGTSRIDFETECDWHQRHQMLKAAFAVDVNSDKASYEIQFGTLERPTHFNTSWDKAKFEVCAQKFADISEGGYGVSLLNNCKYGHDIHDGIMQLSLLKCPTEPNEEADQGYHAFTYSIYPHIGQLVSTDTAEQAYYLNYPMYAVAATGSKSSVPESFSMISVDRDNVICETVKEAEDGEETVIRLYESKNVKSKVNVCIGFDAKRCTVCDLMENELYELPVENGNIALNMGGFEIVTLKFI